MKELKWTATSINDLDKVASEIISYTNPQRFFALYGEMGAGKTTLVKALCRQLGVTDTVQSPTYSILNEYLRENGEPVYHFDFYRVENIREVYDIGYEEYFYSGYFCFAEWPEKIEGLLDFPKADIFISSELNNQRIITCKNE